MSANRLSRLEAVNDLLLFRLSRVTRTVGSLVVRLCEARYGITRREWGLLGLLAVQDGQTLTALNERAGLDKARSSRIVASLVDKGLVRSEPRPSNRRELALWLTDAGRELHDRLMPEVRALNLELLQALDEGEVALLDVWLDRMQAQASQMRDKYEDAWPRTQRRQGSAARTRPGD
jgi:DNA-binding MarR family transcriptional regulator